MPTNQREDRIVELYRLLLQYQKTIEGSIKHKLLFGAVGGSHSFQLANETSDIDIYFFCEGS